MITVLTPTYNRAYTLPRLYESLCSQENPAFEWVVVDDGSEDDTKTIIEKYSEESPFPITYVSQSNRGKMLAVNAGVTVSKGEYVFIVDSDDALTSDAIETISRKIKENDADPKQGYIFRRADLSGRIIGGIPSEEMIICTPTEASSMLKGDLAYIFPKVMLEKYPFPEIKEEKFVPELFIWNKIGDEVPFICYPQKALYRCEYLEDGYSKNFTEVFKANPKGFLLFYKDQFRRDKRVSVRMKICVRIVQGYIYRLVKYVKGL